MDFTVIQTAQNLIMEMPATDANGASSVTFK